MGVEFSSTIPFHYFNLKVPYGDIVYQYFFLFSVGSLFTDVNDASDSKETSEFSEKEEDGMIIITSFILFFCQYYVPYL